MILTYTQALTYETIKGFKILMPKMNRRTKNTKKNRFKNLHKIWNSVESAEAIYKIFKALYSKGNNRARCIYKAYKKS